WPSSRSGRSGLDGPTLPPLDDGGPESMVRLAERAGECAGGHAPALAPPGIPPLLAWEVADSGPTPPTQQPPSVDPRDGGRESLLGTGTHRRRAATETGNPGFPPHGREVSASGRPGARARSQAALAHLRPQS